MNSKIATAALALATTGLSLTGFTGALPAHASAPVVIGGCPDGFQLLSVTALEDSGPYRVPRFVDEGGNGDGWVCGRPLPDAVAEGWCKRGGTVACELLDLGKPVYDFRDDDVPGQAS